MSLENMPLEIMHLGCSIIRASSEPVSDIAEGAEICGLLARKLDELQGAGLAAPQIGLPYRVFVVQVRKTEMFPDRDESPLFAMINPEIEILSDEQCLDFEGCFSVPGYVGIVPRFKKLRVRWLEPSGDKQEQVFEDYLARVIQHEMDHLDGRVYLDRMQDMTTLCTRENFMKSRH